MSLELTLQTSRGAAFLLELWNNAPRCSREVLRSCAARLPFVTAKKNFMLNRYAIQRRLRSHKEKVAKESDSTKFVVMTYDNEITNLK